MGMGKKTGDAGEYEFSRAAYDELREAERQYHVQYVLSLETTGQRGVWALSVVAVADGRDDGLAYVCKWAGTWPNSMAVSYGAFLYQACHRCVRMTEAWYADVQATEHPK